MENKVWGLLGLCSKAGKIIFGTDAVLENIAKRKIKLVIVAKDTSEKNRDKMIEVCKEENIPFIIFGTIFENSKAIGKVNKAMIGIKDKNFADAIQKQINGGDNFGKN